MAHSDCFPGKSAETGTHLRNLVLNNNQNDNEDATCVLIKDA